MHGLSRSIGTTAWRIYYSSKGFAPVVLISIYWLGTGLPGKSELVIMKYNALWYVAVIGIKFTNFQGIIQTDFIEKAKTEVIKNCEMVSFVFMLFLPMFDFLQAKMCRQNNKMASSKKVLNSSSRYWKRLTCSFIIQSLFTILVYKVSGDSLKVFFVKKFRVFYIYVSQNSIWTYVSRGVFGPGKNVRFIVLLLEIKTKYLDTI